MLRKKNFLVVTILLLLVFLVTGCSGFLPKPTKGVISGRVLIPPTAKQLSKDISGWVGAAGAEVTIVDANGVKHTVITDENGYYNFENIAVKANTVVTATVKVDGKTMVLKTVIDKAVGKEQKYDSGAMTPESTALALVVEKLIAEEVSVDLDEIKATGAYTELLGKVTEVLEKQGNVTEDPGVADAAYEAADEVINPPAPPTPTPPSGGGGGTPPPAKPASISMVDANESVKGEDGWTRFAGTVEVKSWVKEGDFKAYYIFEITDGELAEVDENNVALQYWDGDEWKNFADLTEGKYRFGSSGGFDLSGVNKATTEFQVKIDGEKCTGITGTAYLVDAETKKRISNVVEKTISLPVINTLLDRGYFSIQEAIDAAGSDNTIVLNVDIELNDTVEFNNESIELDLNGHSLTTPNLTNTAALPVLQIYGNSDVTIKGDGLVQSGNTINYSSCIDDKPSILVKDGSDLTIKDGATIKGGGGINSGQGAPAIWFWSSSGTLTIENVEIFGGDNINNNYGSNSTAGVAIDLKSTSGATVHITGSTIKGGDGKGTGLAAAGSAIDGTNNGINTINITSSTIQGGNSDSYDAGHAIFVGKGEFTIGSSTVKGGSSLAGVGSTYGIGRNAIHVSPGASGKVDITSSQLYGGDGGNSYLGCGIEYREAIYFTVENSLIFGGGVNGSGKGYGNALYILSSKSTDNLTLSNTLLKLVEDSSKVYGRAAISRSTSLVTTYDMNEVLGDIAEESYVISDNGRVVTIGNPPEF